MKKHLVFGSILGVLAIGLASPMSIRAATIRSTDIYAADGTSGQVLTTGKGVKTGHIQNLAVTGAKIAAGTITTSNIGNSQITNTLLAPNAVTTNKIQDGTIATADLANGAVTNTKITGPISAAKLPVGTSAGTVAAGNHTHDTVYQKKYANLVVVAKSGGDFTDPVAAVNAITDASATNQYLVKIMPGTYDIGNSWVQMKDYVDIEGAGEGATTISGTFVSPWHPIYNPATAHGVIDAANAELRSLTVENRGQAGPGVAVTIWIINAAPRITHVTASAFNSANPNTIMVSSGSAPVLTNVTVKAYAGSSTAAALVVWYSPAVIVNSTISATDSPEVYGIYNSNGGFSTLSNSSVTATSTESTGRNLGIHNAYGSSTVLTNCTVLANGPIGDALWSYDNAGSAVVRANHCIVAGTNNALVMIYYLGQVGSSQLVGGVSGTVCVGAFNGSYSPLGSDCQPLP